MQARNASLIGSLLPRFINDFLNRSSFLFDDLFNVGGMNTPIEDQAAQRAPADFTAYRVEAGDRNGIWRIIYNHIHAGGLLKSFDIAPIAPNDASLHLFIGEDDNCPGYL